MVVDIYTRTWIIEKSTEILKTYTEGITLRQLYYRLVAVYGMTNDIRHYKRVVAGMTSARWDGVIDMEAFIDRERTVFGITSAEVKDLDNEIESTKRTIKYWLEHYNLERWSNQDNFVEVWVEKKALQGVLERVCSRFNVALCPCKGYPSLTFLHEARDRFDTAIENGKNVIILYFGDYDPSGTDIPRSIQENLERMMCEVEVKRIALNPDLIKELNLPSVPPKVTDSRTASWDGLGAVELDAIDPHLLKDICKTAIDEQFDTDKYDELKVLEEKERAIYQDALKDFVNNPDDEEDGDE